MTEPLEPMPVPATLEGERIDSAVALITGWSRADVQVLLARDAIVVDGKPVGKSHRLVTGSVIEILDEPAITALPTGDPRVAVEVRYADDDVVVLAKPVGLVVHSGAGHPDGTLVNGLLALYPEMATVGDEYRPGIVHRLDRDTSGLLVAARTQRAFESLVEQISGRTVERRYVALAWGALSSPRGVIDAPIGRSTARRTRMAVRETGKAARTEYEVRRAFKDPLCSLLDCRLETGRTHQIRVHLSAIGHPLVGDATYGGAREAIPLDRPFLHAAVLGFDQPTTGERLRFEDPLPEDLATVLAKLESDA